MVPVVAVVARQQVQRFGFPIVPDFGGTAHAYCGSTLVACIGDLLQWSATPRRDDALRAYIIISRVRDACNVLIAQPFSPALFSQGVLPGPHLPLQVLSNNMTPKQAEAAWRKIETEKEKGTEGTTSDPMHRLQVPCCRCTDKSEYNLSPLWL